MKFLVDAQLPRSLALWLCEQGYDALHTLDLPEANQTTDEEICAVADAQARIVVTKDADFVSSHELSNTPAQLLLISTGNVSNRDLLALWKSHLHRVLQALEDSPFVELSQHHLIVHG